MAGKPKQALGEGLLFFFRRQRNMVLRKFKGKCFDGNENIGLSTPWCCFQVTRSFAPLTDLRNLAGSDSVDDFSLSYISLLESTPGITPVLLEHILTSRTDLTKQDTKEVCRSTFLEV